MARKKRNPRAKPASLKTPPKVSEAEILAAKAAAAKSKDVVNNENTEAKAEADSSVVCLSHIPHGFYEGQMTKYFSQFGKVKRLRLSRSKKSGRSRGFAFIEFEFPEVAKVVAETMNGYLTYQKIMKCRVLDTAKIHPQLFKGCDEKFKKPWHREASKKRHNSLLTSSEDRIHAAQKRRVQLERRKNKKLEKMGIEFKSSTLEAEWEHLKGPVKKPALPKSKKVEEKKSRRQPRKRKTEDDEETSPKKVKASEEEESEDGGKSSDEELLDDSDMEDESDLSFEDSPSEGDSDGEEVGNTLKAGGKGDVQIGKKAKGTPTSLKAGENISPEIVPHSAKKAKKAQVSTPLKGREQLPRKVQSSKKETKGVTPLKKEKELVQGKNTASAKKGKLSTPLRGKIAVTNESLKKTRSTPLRKGQENAQQKAESEKQGNSISTPKSVNKVTKGKTPKSSKKDVKVKTNVAAKSTPVKAPKKDVKVETNVEVKRTPAKTPKKAVESEKVPKTPKSGKGKTPKSAAKRTKAK